MYSMIGIGMSRFFLYREVFLIRSVLYRWFHCSPKIVTSLEACLYTNDHNGDKQFSQRCTLKVNSELLSL